MPDHTGALRIRPATPDDAARCGDIAVAAWARVHEVMREMLGEELWAVHAAGWEDRKRNEVQSHITRHPQLAIVTEDLRDEGRIVGFLTFSLDHDKHIGQIGNNAVDPTCQGRGVGTAQCRRALDIFREAGMRFAMVWTGLDEGHAPARAMYEKAGFDISTPHVRYFMRL